MRKNSGWMNRRGNTSICRFCEKDVSSIPSETCTEPRHKAQHLSKKARREQTNTALASQWRRRLRVIMLLGGKCVRCPVSDPRVLQINHIHGGGTKERLADDLTGKKLVNAILTGRRSLDDLDLRCANCNIIYEYDRGVRRFILNDKAEEFRLTGEQPPIIQASIPC